jgi:hypothetical protein
MLELLEIVASERGRRIFILCITVEVLCWGKIILCGLYSKECKFDEFKSGGVREKHNSRNLELA